MADQKLSPKELMQIFNNAQTKLIFEDLLSKKPKLHTIAADLKDSLVKYGVDGNRFKELFTIHLDDPENYTFEYNCAAIFIHDLLVKEQFYNEGKDFINKLVEGAHSAEGFKNFALSYEQLQNAAQRSGQSYSATKEQMQKLLDDIKSPVWDTYRKSLKELPTTFPCIRGNLKRGVLEYCQDGDIDYAFSAITANVEEEPGLYASLANTYANMEKDELKDELIELILQLLPIIYSSSPSLISLHSNPEKAESIYEEALKARAATKPETPKLTKDIFGCDLISSDSSKSTSAASSASTSNQSHKGGTGWLIGAVACIVLAFANAGMGQVEAFVPFLVIGVVLGIIGIVRKIKS